MSDLISREALIETIGKLKVDYYVDMNGKHNPIEQANKIINCIEDAPTVEAVPKSYAEQIRWERNVAVGQLNEIGCQFGQKMDEVKKKLEVVHGKWIKSQSMPRSAKCSECKCWITKHSVNELWFRYCPHCGADMRTSAE